MKRVSDNLHLHTHGGVSSKPQYTPEAAQTRATDRAGTGPPAWAARRHRARPAPVLVARNIRYEVADRAKAVSCGGLGAMHPLARHAGLPRAIDRDLRLLKRHLPYHASDHVLSLAYNILAGGTCIEDPGRLRTDEAVLDGLGADSIPDPTTAGDFCRRFAATDVEALMGVKSKIVCKRVGSAGPPGHAVNRSPTYFPMAWRTRMYASNSLRSTSVNFTFSHRWLALAGPPEGGEHQLQALPLGLGPGDPPSASAAPPRTPAPPGWWCGADSKSPLRPVTLSALWQIRQTRRRS